MSNLAFQHFTFGGTQLNQYLDVSEVSRNLAPERRFSRTEVQGMDGEHITPNALEALEINVTAYLKSQTLEEVFEQKHTLAKLLYSESVQNLSLPDDPNRHYKAYYRGGSELSRATHRPKVTLKFLCPDPVAYGENKSLSIANTSYVTVAVGGNYTSYPTITAKPASGASYFDVYDRTASRYVRVHPATAFTGSQTVVIDMENQRCTFNGSEYPVHINSTFFGLNPNKTQFIQISSGSATMTWTERWL